MGFFSARRAEDSSTTFDDASVVIRSRFYGSRSKGKEREIDSPPSASQSQTPYPYASSPAASTASFTTKVADKRSVAGSIRAPRTSTSAPRKWLGSSATSPRRDGNVTDMASSRISISTDIVTVTLAQRLNELATANAEGLLSDDEYRLLRQNLFERFASGSAVPTEAPIVSMSRLAQSNRNLDSRTSGRRPSPHYHVQNGSLRSPSITSMKSFSSTVTGLLRRATSRRIVSLPAESKGGDAMSVYSVVSSTAEPATLPRKLSKQTSDTSLRTDTSISRHSQTFKRRTVIGNHTFSATDPGPQYRPRTRSGSRTAPPSSFTTYTHISMNEIPNDDQVESVQDIRHQIELVEAEGRRLLDAFNGLELSTLTRGPRKPPVIPPLPLLNDGNWPPALRVKEVDAMSMKSSGSGVTTRSHKPVPKIRSAASATALSSQAAVVRKASMSSMSSRGRSALPTMAGHLGLASSSSVNLARSTGHLPLETVEETEGNPLRPVASKTGSMRRESRRFEGGLGSPVSPAAQSEVGSTSSSSKRGAAGAQSQFDEEELGILEGELADIRRRRTEVTARYECRLEYLQARLKGAELREKILRK